MDKDSKPQLKQYAVSDLIKNVGAKNHWQILFTFRQSSAYDFNKDVGLIMVGGELCTDSIWCNDYVNRTLLSKNGGRIFKEMAPFPKTLRGHCAVFIDETTLMVMGGYELSKPPHPYYDETYMLNTKENVWSSGPPLNLPRAYHTCNIVTNCDGKQQVVVVGGYSGVCIDGICAATYTNAVEIYDVESGAWSAGKN